MRIERWVWRSSINRRCHGAAGAEQKSKRKLRLTFWAYDSVFEAELQDVVPICRATIAGTRIVGRLTAG